MYWEFWKTPIRIKVTGETFERIDLNLQKKIAYPCPIEQDFPLKIGSKVIFERDVKPYSCDSLLVDTGFYKENLIRYIKRIENRNVTSTNLSEFLSNDDINALSSTLQSRGEQINQIEKDLSLIVNFQEIKLDGCKIAIFDLNSPSIKQLIITSSGLLIFIGLVIWGWYKGWIWNLCLKIYDLFKKDEKQI